MVSKKDIEEWGFEYKCSNNYDSSQEYIHPEGWALAHYSGNFFIIVGDLNFSTSGGGGLLNTKEQFNQVMKDLTEVSAIGKPTKEELMKEATNVFGGPGNSEGGLLITRWKYLDVDHKYKYICYWGIEGRGETKWTIIKEELYNKVKEHSNDFRRSIQGA